jgi:alpha/beta superfamily hydrolase
VTESVADPNRLPGARDVRVTLDGDGGETVVVACPPHPQYGGDRHDSRLRAVSDALRAEGVDCLRIDYGPWDGGNGERTDALTALEWAAAHYDRVGLFGYSFGGAIALLAAAAATGDVAPRAVSALAPAAQVGGDLDVIGAVGEIEQPLQIVYGERDDTADWEPVVERARERDASVESLPADHFFVSQQDRIGDRVAGFLAEALAER